MTNDRLIRMQFFDLLLNVVFHTIRNGYQFIQPIYALFYTFFVGIIRNLIQHRKREKFEYINLKGILIPLENIN